MFTHNIRNIVLIGKSAMKWKNHNDTQKALEDLNRDDSVADLLKKAELAHEEIQKFQGEPIPDAYLIERAVDRLAKILAKIDPKNMADRQAVLDMLDSQKNSAAEDSESKKALDGLLEKFLTEYNIFDSKTEASKEEVRENTKIASNRVFESVVQKNSRDIQARDFTEYVASKLKAELREQFLEAVTKKDSTGNIAYELTNVSIPNLIRSVTEGTVYVADGAEWNDRYALGKFMEVYSANTDVFNTILKPLAIAANAGQSVESMRKSGKLKDNADNSEIIQYLAKVDNFETQGTTALDRQLSAATVFLLDSVKGDDNKFLDVLSKAAKLGGYEGTVDKASITTNPSLKYSILAGIRQASRLPGGINSLRDTKSASGIGENERKVLETLDASKTKLLDGLKDGFQKQLANQIKDGTINADQANDAQKAIDAYIADMKAEGSPGWNIISKNLGAAITNRGAGAAVGATMNFPQNWLADNVSLGIGFSTGKPGVGVGITFDKSVTQDTKILYGWAGVPFVGMTTQFDKWHFTGIGGIGGGLLNVSRDMGNKDLEVKNMEGMKSADKILSQIEGLATVDKKAKAITFEQDVSSYPESSNNPMEPTQSRVTALNAAINTDIQNRLSVAGFDSENNTVVRSQMIYNALTQAIQSRIDLLHMDDATGGWSLKSLGLTLGSFAGLPFILPSISFGRTSYTQSVKLEKNQDRQVSTPITTATRGTSGMSDIQTKFDSLDKVDSLNTLLTKKETRLALSHLWNNPARKEQVNAFAKSLQSFQMGEMATIDECKTAFISLTKGLGELSSLSRVVAGITDSRELQSALFDIRGAMMMDENQAKTLTTQGGITINESPAATEKRFDDILKSGKLSPLLTGMGLTKEDFAGVVNKVGGNNSALTLTEPKPRLVGAVASLKTSEHRMDIMPAGTMRFGKNDAGIEFIKDASNFDPSKKAKMYDAILPEGSLSEGHLRKNIATALQQTEPISSKELKDLMITGKVNIGGKEVSMTGQKFYLGAYGDCTNPCIALEPGKISVPGTPGVPVTADEPEYNIRTGSSIDTIGLTGAIGWVGERPKDKPKPEPKKEEPKEEPKKEEPKPSASTNPQSGKPQEIGTAVTNSYSGPVSDGKTHAQGPASSAATTTPSGTLTMGSSPIGVQPRDTTITPAPAPVVPSGTRPR